MLTTKKKSIARLVELCRRHELTRIIFSPGSRNAPLVIGFSAEKEMICDTIADERVAAFVALGKSIALAKPAIICCTSGSAVLNYAPAIVEAYYHRVPLLILTADRPSEWIDQGIGQSMRQKDVYKNYVKGSYQLIEEARTDEELIANDNVINDAINLTMEGAPGPVHINIPFYEPLYEQEELKEFTPKLHLQSYKKPNETILNDEDKEMWTRSSKKLILVGLIHPNKRLNAILKELSQRGDLVVMTETTSNQYLDNSIQCIDRVLECIGATPELIPDLLISIGGPIVSKKIKQYFFQHKPANHWYLDPGALQDTFRARPKHIKEEAEHLLSLLLNLQSLNHSRFNNSWYNLQKNTSAIASSYIQDITFSDLLVFDTIFHQLPLNSLVHLANSTPVRYAQLFDQRPDLRFYSNRGVSGIDGSTSTAMGIASETQSLNVLITGDISFLYDSNAFWQKSIPDNLKIILINNGGGGIFRCIPGPDSTDRLEDVFEAHHELTAEHIAAMYKLTYKTAENITQLHEALDYLWQSKKTSLLEVFTPRLSNDKVLKGFFKHMKTG